MSLVQEQRCRDGLSVWCRLFLFPSLSLSDIPTSPFISLKRFFILVALISFRLGQSPVKNKLRSCAHTYTCTFTAYQSMHMHVYVRARTSTSRVYEEHTIEICVYRRSVCAHTRPLAGRSRIKMASFYVCCDELHDLP